MDQSLDASGQQLYRLTQLFSPPEFVKNASMDDMVGEPELGSDCYADPVHRLFPCHSQAATWISTGFFLQKQAELNSKDATVIDDRLQAYAKYHRIEHSINALRTKFAAAKTAALTANMPSDDDYGLVYNDGAETRRHYPLRNSEEVKKAAEYLQANRDFFPYPLRRDFADRIMQKIAAHGVKLPSPLTDFIERVAGHGACLTKTAVHMLRDRVKAASGGPGPLTEVQLGLLALANTLEQKPSSLREPAARVKLASLVDDFDRAHGIHLAYGEELLRPEDVIFEMTGEKMASAAADHVVNPATGAIYRLSDLERVKIADVREHLGDELANEVIGLKGYMDSEKAAAIIPTMDRGFAAQFDQMMTSLGVMPIAKEASAEYMKYSHKYLKDVADNYAAERRSAAPVMRFGR